MHSVSQPPTGGRIAFRCDGDGQIGAGHVARCLPLATAFAGLGWGAGFVGSYDGLAAWLVARAGLPVQAPDAAAACGVECAAWDAAVVDSYKIPPASICKLAGRLPLVTLAEASRCPTAGILLDYHLDRTEPPQPRLLAGAAFAPLDPAFTGAGRAADVVRNVLVTVGGSLPARELLAQIVPAVRSVFPDAQVQVAGAPPQGASTSDGRVVGLPSPSALVDVVADVDLAVTAAGFTAYEMACAGIPQVAIAIVENQRRVVSALRASQLAPCLDLSGGDKLADLPATLARLKAPDVRREYAERGRRSFDGAGARRSAIALAERFAEVDGVSPLARTTRDAGS